eukprot:Phypoly_transcript_15661.p1 GENE.Phypoly_transcript_15661~~Phypoly_transcript_15661.p1  ORF type:complete len:293 (+),score=36.29 Phypoly_transcript_15661:38-880(+)
MDKYISGVILKNIKLLETEESGLRTVQLYTALGYFVASESVGEVLWAKAKKGNYWATIGLLHCEVKKEEIKEDILEAIMAIEGRRTFYETLPSLIWKASEDAFMADMLMEFGLNCSSDCNHGLLMGIAFCPDKSKARKLLEEIAFSDKWEAFSLSTGTGGFFFWAADSLGYTVFDFCDAIVSDKCQDKWSAIQDAFSWLNMHMNPRDCPWDPSKKSAPLVEEEVDKYFFDFSSILSSVIQPDRPEEAEFRLLRRSALDKWRSNNITTNLISLIYVPLCLI